MRRLKLLDVQIIDDTKHILLHGLANNWTCYRKKLAQLKKVMRPEVEKPRELFGLAQNDSVALLIVGDPLQATTHIDLQLQAEEKVSIVMLFTASRLLT